MSRYMEYGTPADPLQRSRAGAVARRNRPAPSHPLHDGLIAIAPRLALVFFVASAIQLLLNWVGR